MQRFTWLVIAIVVGVTVAASSCTHDKNPLFCNDSSTCAVAGKPYCDVVRHECLAAPDGFTPFDFSTTDGDASMSECANTTQCTTPNKPICNSAGTCSQCLASDDKAACMTKNASTPRCDSGSGKCVECLPGVQNASDCTGAKPVCGTDNTCRACKAHAECAPGACKADGSCVDATQIYYVDSRNAANVPACKGTHPTADGSSSNAFCDISDATGAVTKRPYVVVAASSAEYGPLSFTITQTQTIIGPGTKPGMQAVLYGSAADSIIVNPVATNSITLVIDGLTVGKSAMPTTGNGIACTQSIGTTANVTLKNSIVQKQGAAGVLAAGCTITLEANSIIANAGGGLKFTDVQYTTTNNFITDNVGTGFGVSLAGNSSGLFWFNTVAGNSRGVSVTSAINCGSVAPAPLIQASVVWGNSKDGSGVSVTGGCSLTNTDTDEMTLPTGAGNFKTDPAFIASGTGNYGLQSSSPAKDKVTAATGLTGGTLPTSDVVGTPRPRTGTNGYDIGAFQIP